MLPISFERGHGFVLLTTKRAGHLMHTVRTRRSRQYLTVVPLDVHRHQKRVMRVETRERTSDTNEIRNHFPKTANNGRVCLVRGSCQTTPMMYGHIQLHKHTACHLPFRHPIQCSTSGREDGISLLLILNVWQLLYISNLLSLVSLHSRNV